MTAPARIGIDGRNESGPRPQWAMMDATTDAIGPRVWSNLALTAPMPAVPCPAAHNIPCVVALRWVTPLLPDTAYSVQDVRANVEPLCACESTVVVGTENPVGLAPKTVPRFVGYLRSSRDATLPGHRKRTVVDIAVCLPDVKHIYYPSILNTACRSSSVTSAVCCGAGLRRRHVH